MSGSKGSLLWSSAAIAVLAGSVLGGCDSVGPGDYVVYRVSFSELEQGSSCYPDKFVPYDVRSDSTTLRSSDTFILYAGAEDKFYLDTGDTTLEGTQDGDKYSFEGKAVDVSYDTPDGQGSKRTSTLTTTIEMTVDGEVVTGTAKNKTSYKCSGNTCGQPIPSCTETGDFVGTEVDDLKLKHDVN
jgi:hypothetical protein